MLSIHPGYHPEIVSLQTPPFSVPSQKKNKSKGKKNLENKRKTESGGKKDLLGVEVVPSLPGQLGAFAMQITCEEHQKVSGEKKTRGAGGQQSFVEVA